MMHCKAECQFISVIALRLQPKAGGVLSYSNDRGPILITGDRFWPLWSCLLEVDILISPTRTDFMPKARSKVSKGEVVETAREGRVRWGWVGPDQSDNADYSNRILGEDEDISSEITAVKVRN